MGWHDSEWMGMARRLLAVRAIRFALVGGAGIPINVGFLWLYYSLLSIPMKPAWVLAFVCSALINFYTNQRFTYGEQKHVRGWDWPVRAAKAQVSSLAGLLVNVAVFSWLLRLGMHYLPADAAGIVAAFSVNFLVSRHFVFLPAVGARNLEYPSGEWALSDGEGVGGG